MYPRTQLFRINYICNVITTTDHNVVMYGKGALALTFCTTQNMKFLIDHVLRVYQVNDLYLYKPSTKETWQSTTINQQKYYPL